QIVRTRGGSPQREVTGQMVFVCLLAFFGVVVAVNAVMIRAATSTFGGVETESAYQAGRVFARELSAIHDQDARHWNVAATITSRRDATTVVEVVARDAADAPLSKLAAGATLLHPADLRLDRIVALDETAAGRFAGTLQL